MQAGVFWKRRAMPGQLKEYLTTGRRKVMQRLSELAASLMKDFPVSGH
jgi:hypothetical protein